MELRPDRDAFHRLRDGQRGAARRVSLIRETIIADWSAAVKRPTNRHRHPDLNADSPARPIRAHGPRSAKRLRRQHGPHYGKR